LGWMKNAVIGFDGGFNFGMVQPDNNHGQTPDLFCAVLKHAMTAVTCAGPILGIIVRILKPGRIVFPPPSPQIQSCATRCGLIVLSACITPG